MMGIAPFERESEIADERLIRELDGIRNTLPIPSAGLVGLESDTTQISGDMRSARQSSYEERKAYYLALRIAEERQWYEKKATFNRMHARARGTGSSWASNSLRSF